jgi:hypothetical protein
VKQHLFRKEKDEEYNAPLAGRLCEDEQIRKRRTFEDSKIYHEGTLEDEIVYVFLDFEDRIDTETYLLSTLHAAANSISEVVKAKAQSHSLRD